MQRIVEIDTLKSLLHKHYMKSEKIGFIPTMGYLHDGHLSLIKESSKENEITVVSIFVNPAQFGPNADLDKYPRNIEKDEALCRDLGVDYIFYPEEKLMYPENYQTWVEVYGLTDLLDGSSRPGYFKGICTIVLKLFNIVKPNNTYFGQKDIQQALVIQKMITDLHLDINLKIMPIIREVDGLAMSSRNAYLKGQDRQIATCLYKGLSEAEKLFLNGERQSDKLIQAVQTVLEEEKEIVIDYIEIVDAKKLQKISKIENIGILAIATDLHGTRLIDNVILKSF